MSCDHYGWWLLLINPHHFKFSWQWPMASLKLKYNVFLFVTWPHATAWTKGCVTLKIVAPYHTPPSCLASWPQVSWKWRHNVLIFSMWPDVSTWLTGYVTYNYNFFSFIRSNAPVKFGSYRPRESENMTFFICHVITWPRDERVTWLCWRSSFTLTH